MIGCRSVSFLNFLISRVKFSGNFEFTCRYPNSFAGCRLGNQGDLDIGGFIPLQFLNRLFYIGYIGLGEKRVRGLRNFKRNTFLAQNCFHKEIDGGRGI